MADSHASPTYPYRNNFDALRLLLAFLVLLSHGRAILELPFTSVLFYQAEIAVHGFFITSGFLISWSIDRAFNARNYAIKRLCRIYPLYAFVIITQILILHSFNTDPFQLQDFTKYLASNLAALNFIQPTFGSMVNEPINGSLWTIKIELMFYAAMPIYLWFYKRYGIPFLLFSFVCAFAYRFGLADINIQWARQLPGSMTFFIAGSTLYFYGASIERYCRTAKGISALISGFIALACLSVFHEYAHQFMMLAILTLAIYLFAFKCPIIRIPVDISYGIYLWHVPIFLTIHHLYGSTIDAITLCIISTMVILAISWLSALCIEQPAMRWAKQKTA